MIYYAPTIFAQLGLSGNTTSLLATGACGIVNCLSTLPALFFIDKVGRRVLLMAGATGTCISLAIVGGTLGGYGSSLPDHKSAGWVGIAFIYIYDIDQFSLLFCIIGLVTPDMLDSVTYGTYIFFAVFCLLALGFTSFCIPETRGKTLEDMDLIFGDTTAHEEKKRIKRIKALLRGTPIVDDDDEFLKPADQQAEIVDDV
ncbi:hypothetical protein N7520_006828 [Penicillium odoratum]|uniref:uncharacterized protein n=1 Tax=Penicillium odoratum TaxID=1167516 RepID=UPI00254919DB|nr:uncharacterized protein N7520_006828 [Penicillium odoratum]KAJ5759672.1 hypothetical protein N7520_006828 [Penicillium odoratum]